MMTMIRVIMIIMMMAVAMIMKALKIMTIMMIKNPQKLQFNHRIQQRVNSLKCAC